MKTVFLKRENTPALRVFFNGWSRDAHCFDGWTSDCDVLEVHDYTELDTAVFSELLKPYSELHLAAWSLGVWAAAKVFEKVSVRLDSALALNGTLVPVHADYGIAPEIFDGTIIHWDDLAARERFLRRMAGTGAAAQRMPLPERTPDDQQRELAAIRHDAAESAVPRNIYQTAAAGKRDRIIPFAAQRNFWQSEPETAFRELDLPHYPFDGITAWEEVFRLGNPG